MYWTGEYCLKLSLPRSPSNEGNTSDEADKADKDIRGALYRCVWEHCLWETIHSYHCQQRLATGTRLLWYCVFAYIYVHLYLGYSYHDVMDVLHIIPFACFWFPRTQCDIGSILVSAFQCVSSRLQRIFKVVMFNMYFHDPTCLGHMICFL